MFSWRNKTILITRALAGAMNLFWQRNLARVNKTYKIVQPRPTMAKANVFHMNN